MKFGKSICSSSGIALTTVWWFESNRTIVFFLFVKSLYPLCISFVCSEIARLVYWIASNSKDRKLILHLITKGHRIGLAVSELNFGFCLKARVCHGDYTSRNMDEVVKDFDSRVHLESRTINGLLNSINATLWLCGILSYIIHCHRHYIYVSLLCTGALSAGGLLFSLLCWCNTVRWRYYNVNNTR